MKVRRVTLYHLVRKEIPYFKEIHLLILVHYVTIKLKT